VWRRRGRRLEWEKEREKREKEREEVPSAPSL
jgi:hypothetical protein